MLRCLDMWALAFVFPLSSETKQNREHAGDQRDEDGSGRDRPEREMTVDVAEHAEHRAESRDKDECKDSGHDHRYCVCRASDPGRFGESLRQILRARYSERATRATYMRSGTEIPTWPCPHACVRDASWVSSKRDARTGGSAFKIGHAS